MTAPAVPLRPTTGPFVVTQRERAQAAAWCASRGPAWAAEAICAEDGGVALGLVTPRREAEAAGGPPMVAWLVERTARGLALLDGVTCEAVGVFPSMSAVLAAVAEAEGPVAVNDNEAA